MLIEAALLPRNLLSEGNQICNFIGTVSVKTFVIPFYYGSGSGSAKAKSYGSFGSDSDSGSATLVRWCYLFGCFLELK